MYILVGSLEDIIIQSNIFKHILHTNYDLKAEIGGNTHCHMLLFPQHTYNSYILIAISLLRYCLAGIIKK